MSHFDRCWSIFSRFLRLGMEEERLARIMRAIGADRYFMPWEIPEGKRIKAYAMRAVMRKC